MPETVAVCPVCGNPFTSFHPQSVLHIVPLRERSSTAKLPPCLNPESRRSAKNRTDGWLSSSLSSAWASSPRNGRRSPPWGRPSPTSSDRGFEEPQPGEGQTAL